MSKKLNSTRLDNLFAGFEDNEPFLPIDTKEASHSWTWSVGLDGKYTECSPEVAESLGFKAESFIKRSLFTYAISPESSETLRAIVNDQLFPAETEIKFISKSGELITARVTIFQSFDEKGSIAGWHGINLEIDRQQIFPEFKPQKTIPARTPAKPVVKEEPTTPVLSEKPAALQAPAPPLQVPTTKKDGPGTEVTSLSAPIQVGGKTEALIELLETSPGRKWSEDDRLLLDEVARQVSLALENARLYEDIRKALAVLETRERYQANIARAVAILTQSGTAALPEFLDALGQATRCGKITITRFITGAKEHWTPVAEWNNPDLTASVHPSRWEVEAADIPNWRKQLAESGWVAGTLKDAPLPEGNYLKAHNLGASLLLAVTYSSASESGFIAFDHPDAGQALKKEEIGLLRVAADAFSNTNARQDLLGKLQVSLTETESLYNTSHRLALATNMEEMVSIIMKGVGSLIFNRAVLILFESDNQGKLSRLKVSANWYSGKGTLPLAVGTEYPVNVYFRLFQSAAPQFFDDMLETELDPTLHDLLAQQNARSTAILPLWANNKQTGVFLLLSDEIHHLQSSEMHSFPPLVDQMATAIENLSLFIQTQEALSETALLYQVSNRIAQATDTGELVRLVAQKMLPANAETASIFTATYNPDNKLSDFVTAGSVSVDGQFHPAGTRIPVSALPYITRLTQDLEIIPDIQKSQLDPITQKTLQQLNILSACIVPLRSAGRLIGLLVASAQHATDYNPDEARLLQVAGSGIAVALERQRLLTEAQQRALELQTAAEIARDTTSTLSLDILLERIVTLLSGQFNFYHTAIYLLDDHAKYAVVREANGDAGLAMKKKPYRLSVGSRSAVGSATLSGKPAIYNDVSKNPFFVANPLLPETRSQMALPLKLGERVIGALDIQSRELNAFNPDDVAVIQILADQIAVAIENARSYELSQKALADIQEVDRLKSQFLANMSHELRTPLNSIIGFSRVILKGIDGPVNDTQKQDLGAIYNSGQHLLALITDILDLSKIEAGKMELQFADVNLGDLINSAMSTAVGLVKDKPIKLFHSVPPNLPVIRADATRVRQVLINFLSNASKFTAQGTISVEASVVEPGQNQPQVMVTVTDTGIGISVEDQAKLFQPFSQVDDSPTRKTGGTGLGLSISRSLIELHGGQIGLLRSEVGNGSTFFFTLPIRRDTTAGLSITQSLEKTVLSIDDDPQVISLYERYLKPSGFRVVSLTNPKEAVSYARQIRPYAITLDIMMPEKDGWQVLQELKNNPDTRQIPIIICSIMEDEEKGFSLGASDYLVKPFLQEELINTLNRLNPEGKISRILVIDDDAESLRLVEKILKENSKYEITLANGGKNGWAHIEKQIPDAIIMDLFMPELDGFTLLEKLRTNPPTKNLPVIVLTGAELTQEQYSRLAEFGQHLLDKGSINEKELLATLQKTLRSINN